MYIAGPTTTHIIKADSVQALDKFPSCFKNRGAHVCYIIQLRSCETGNGIGDIRR